MADMNTIPGQDLRAGNPGPQAQEPSDTWKWSKYQTTGNSAEIGASGASGYGSVASNAYDLRLYMALSGAALLVIGTFLPIFTLSAGSESESINYYGTGGGSGWLILVFAAIAAFQAFARRYKGPAFTGGAALALMIWDLISVSAKSSEVSDLGASLDIGWAWLVLIAGAVLLIWSPWAPGTENNY